MWTIFVFQFLVVVHANLIIATIWNKTLYPLPMQIMLAVIHEKSNHNGWHQAINQIENHPKIQVFWECSNYNQTSTKLYSFPNCKWTRRRSDPNYYQKLVEEKWWRPPSRQATSNVIPDTHKQPEAASISMAGAAATEIKQSNNM
jgi:hypothetical protein